MSGPEDNPADEVQPTKEEWEKAMEPICPTCNGTGIIMVPHPLLGYLRPTTCWCQLSKDSVTVTYTKGQGPMTFNMPWTTDDILEYIGPRCPIMVDDKHAIAPDGTMIFQSVNGQWSVEPTPPKYPVGPDLPQGASDTGWDKDRDNPLPTKPVCQGPEHLGPITNGVSRATPPIYDAETRCDLDRIKQRDAPVNISNAEALAYIKGLFDEIQSATKPIDLVEYLQGASDAARSTDDRVIGQCALCECPLSGDGFGIYEGGKLSLSFGYRSNHDCMSLDTFICDSCGDRFRTDMENQSFLRMEAIKKDLLANGANFGDDERISNGG